MGKRCEACGFAASALQGLGGLTCIFQGGVLKLRVWGLLLLHEHSSFPVQVRLNGGPHTYAQHGTQSAGHYAASPQADPWANGNDPWSQSQMPQQVRQQPHYPPSAPHAAPYRPAEGPPGAPHAPQFTPKPAPAAAQAYNGVGKGFGKQVPPGGAPLGPVPQHPPQRAPDPSKGSGKTALSMEFCLRLREASLSFGS